LIISSLSLNKSIHSSWERTRSKPFAKKVFLVVHAVPIIMPCFQICQGLSCFSVGLRSSSSTATSDS
jgi:hypothetical protein